ncbi:helix-turn-helix transcriptional regulator [Lysobacter sp. M15]|uniref:helix-turn-helix domain-containing protein n=1 Tax=Lysobacter sp. M15 TaxID=2916837 RepID=UPI001F570539|nr:helix-turn-helix transcriptional regulator [Lysobacter sp. M15]
MKAPLRQRFGKRIKDLRKERGISQEALADKCGYTRAYMSRIETGAARLSIDAIEVLGTALRMPLSEMFKGL